MTTMAIAFSYEDVDSSAIMALKGDDNGIFVTFRGKNPKNTHITAKMSKNLQKT